MRTGPRDVTVPDDRDIQTHFSQLEELFAKLARTNDPVSEKDKSVILLRSFSPSRSFTAIIAQATNASYIDIRTLLKSEAKLRVFAVQASDHPQPANLVERLSIATSAHALYKQNKSRIAFWYFRGRGHAQSKCLLRRRND